MFAARDRDGEGGPLRRYRFVTFPGLKSRTGEPEARQDETARPQTQWESGLSVKIPHLNLYAAIRYCFFTTEVLCSHPEIGTVATCLAGRSRLASVVTSPPRGTEGHSLTQFTRNVQFAIKPGQSQTFTNVMEKEILPMMKKQDGFRGQLALVNEDRAVGISCWDSEQHAETYRTNVYPKVLESLKTVIDGTPSVENFVLASNTFRS